jgi:hypothetical protein
VDLKFWAATGLYAEIVSLVYVMPALSMRQPFRDVPTRATRGRTCAPLAWRAPSADRPSLCRDGTQFKNKQTKQPLKKTRGLTSTSVLSSSSVFFLTIRFLSESLVYILRENISCTEESNWILGYPQLLFCKFASQP